MRQQSALDALSLNGRDSLPPRQRMYFDPRTAQKEQIVDGDYMINMGTVYGKEDRAMGIDYYDTGRNFAMPYAGITDSNDSFEGMHAMISGQTGSGKTTFSENLTLSISKRKNPWVIVIHSVKGDMEESWMNFKRKASTYGKKVKYIKFNVDSNAKLLLDLFPLATLENMAMLSGTEQKRKMRDIFYFRKRNVLSTLNYIRECVQSKEGKFGYANWMSSLISSIDSSPYLTSDREQAIHLEPYHIYIFDYSEIEDLHERDLVFGSAYRLVRNTVKGKKNFQAFHVVDEFYKTVTDSQANELKDTYNEIKDCAVTGRQQGISQILCFQSLYNNRKIVEPLLQSQYCFQLLSSGASDKKFFLETVVQKRIDAYEYEEFFSKSGEKTSVTGRCIVFNRRTAEDPKYLQLHLNPHM